MQGKLSGEPVVLFASTPNLGDLCSVTVRVVHGTEFSTTQPRILKCRELIFTEPDVIASPSYDQFDCFSVIMPQTVFKTGRIQTRMRNNHLQVSKPFRVNPALYQACLRYTVLARLAPAWNKAGDWLIQGRDFLTHSGCANAVKCDLVANMDELYVSVCAAVLRLSPLQLADLNLSELEVQSLLYNAEHHRGELSLHSTWCRVMPSMKKGRLCSISLSVPEDSPFATYRDLRRHWKNTYGFRLPETDDDMFFGQISFGGMGGKQFTYPSVCLRSEPLQCVPRVEPKPILSAFLQDLHCKVPHVCGHPLRFQPQVRHTVSAFYSASQEVTGPGPNLSKRSSAGGSQVPLRNPRDLIQQNRTRQQFSNLSQIASLKAAAERRSTAGYINTGDASLSQARSGASQPLSQTGAVSAEKAGGGTCSQLPRTSAQPCGEPSRAEDPQRSRDMGPGPDVGGGTPSLAEKGKSRNGINTSSVMSTPASSRHGAGSQCSDGTGVWARETLAPDPPQLQVSRKAPLYLNRSSRLVAADGDSGDQGQPARHNPLQLREKEKVAAPEIQGSTHTKVPEGKHLPPKMNTNANEDISSSSAASGLLASASSSVTLGTSGAGNRLGIPKFVPVFRPKTSSGSSTKNCSAKSSSEADTSQAAGGSSNKTVPVFKPKAKTTKPLNLGQAKPAPSHRSTAKPKTAAAAPVVSNPLVASSTRDGKLGTSSTRVGTLMTSFTRDDTLVTSSTTDDTLLSSSCSTSFPTPMEPGFPARTHKANPARSPSVRSSGPRTPQPRAPLAGKLKQKMVEAGKAGVKDAKGVGINAVGGCGSQGAAPSPALLASPGEGRVDGTPVCGLWQEVVPPTPSGSQGKRKMDTQGAGDGGEKRPRSKPQVQDVDVEMLAKSDQLSKVNTVTLIAWLRERGVHCKAKDKKADLVERVKVFLALTSPEP